MPEDRQPDRLVLCAHKCRGKMEWEVAIMWDFGTPNDPAPWYILQATGNRIYPYVVFGFPHGLVADVPPPPESHRDFYDVRLEERKAPPQRKQLKTMDDFL